MATHDPHDEDHDLGLDALDFFPAESSDEAPELDWSPDFAGPDSRICEPSEIEGGFDSLPADMADEVDGSNYDDHDWLEPDSTAAEDQMSVIHTVNPPGTVTISTYLTGVISRVELDPRVTTMTEAQLAEEVCAVADVAAKRATAIIHDSIVGSLVEHGLHQKDAQYFVETNMPFATPEQASEAERALIARHSDESH